MSDYQPSIPSRTMMSAEAVHPIQLRVALATPSGWTDAIVTWAAASAAEVRTLDGEIVVIVNPRRDLADLEPGTPVALHRLYGVLATGDSYVGVDATTFRA